MQEVSDFTPVRWQRIIAFEFLPFENSNIPIPKRVSYRGKIMTICKPHFYVGIFDPKPWILKTFHLTTKPCTYKFCFTHLNLTFNTKHLPANNNPHKIRTRTSLLTCSTRTTTECPFHFLRTSSQKISTCSDSDWQALHAWPNQMYNGTQGFEDVKIFRENSCMFLMLKRLAFIPRRLLKRSLW